MSERLQENQVTLRCRCPFCGRTADVTVPEQGYNEWRSGALIQKALPSTSPELREMLVSGVCPDCWEAEFSSPAE